MPELPEVETIRLQLEKTILNKKIEEVIIKDRRVIKGTSPKIFKSQVEKKSVKDIERRGKVLIIKLEENLYLTVHLKLTGIFILSKEEEKFSRIIFKLSDSKLLNFCDLRAFGEIKLLSDYRDLPLIKAMGPEPLELTKENFVKKFIGKKTKIKPLLMDQNFLAGVGNIYAQEALFCAGIHPERQSAALKKGELEKIYSCLISILKEAIEKKGSSVDTYRQTDGETGGYAPLLKVYQRKGFPCVRCKAKIVRESIAGRGTFFCPRCQK